VRGLSVLVVDDNATNRRILDETLTGWGMRPTCVEGGEQALAALERAQEAGEPFTLVLTDAQMPEMDGFTLAERIQQRPGLTLATVMMLSSAAQPGTMARRRELGIARHLTKPVKQAELFKAILAALGEGEAEGRSRRVERGAPKATAGGPSAPLRILLAEDNPFNQKLALGLLGREGHTVVVAANGREAVAALGREPFDVVLMDVSMPEMDGFQATEVIRRSEEGSGRHVPIVAMTAHAMKGDRERCLEAGMDGYVSKPIRAAELFETLAAVSRSPAPPAAPEGPAEAVPPGEAPDWEAALKQVGDDPELLAELVGIFLKAAPGWLDDIRRAREARDAGALQKVAHKFKGALGQFCALTAYEQAQRADKLARDGDFAGADAACHDLEQTLERLRPALAAFVRTA
jgi:CheY-like chemotaxis protein